LNDENIKQVVRDYLSQDENVRMQTIAKYGDISTWDVQNVTNMNKLFEDFHDFNEDISNWNVSNVTNMESMFLNATAFNHPLNEVL
jgi:surface protein